MGTKTIYGYQKSGEKYKKRMEKELTKSDIPVKRKIRKTIRKYHFPGIFGWFFGIFIFTGMYVGLRFFVTFQADFFQKKSW